MCTVCGCGEGETTIEGHSHPHKHSHDHEHSHDDDHHHDYGQGAAHAHAPGMSQSRMVQIETDILGKNNEYAALNRRWFAEHHVLTLNLVSSPGSGKTSLLTRTIDDLKNELKLAVIEGDQQTANDAERIRSTGNYNQAGIQVKCPPFHCSSVYKCPIVCLQNNTCACRCCFIKENGNGHRQ